MSETDRLLKVDETGSVNQPAAAGSRSTDYILKPSDFKIPEHKTEARMRFSVFSLANTIIGGGVLSLPYAFYLTGAVLGAFALLLVALFAIFSLYLLTDCAELSGLSAHASYREVGRVALGRGGVVAVDMSILLACFGVVCSYLLIISDTVVPLIASVSEMDPETIKVILMCSLMALLIPISAIRYLNHLRFTSLFALMATLFFILCILIRSLQELVQVGLDDCENSDKGCVRIFNFNAELLKAIPIISFSYTCQMNFYSTYEELAAPSPRRIHKVIRRAVAVCMTIYMLAGLFGYLNFRDATLGNILLNYGLDDGLILVGRIMIAIEIIFGLPMSVHPMLRTIEHLFFSQKEFSWPRRIIETVLLLGLALVIALTVTDISFIFALTGATASTMISFILPSLFFLKIHPERSWLSRAKLPALLFFILGIIFSVAATVVTILDEVGKL